MSHYEKHQLHYLAVDCIIFGFDDNDLRLLLINRNFEPCKGQMSLMGGFVTQDESLDAAASRVLKELTGLEAVYLEQLAAYGDPQRDSAGRVVSMAYYALIRTGDYNKELAAAHRATWVPVNNVPDLVFDHNEMVDKALRRLKRKSKIQPVGFELLPRQFTVRQLQRLYEAIWQEKIDERNFRKKIFGMNILHKLDTKDKSSSKKGSFLYEFDKERYEMLIETGFHFNL